MRTEPYRVVIVEDEPAQQKLVAGMLRECGNFNIVGVAADVSSGLSVIQESRPELVVLDVILPPGNCFELLNKLGKPSFKTIFTTSYDTYAIRAFRLSAIDYLLKPLDSTEFRQAIEKFKELLTDEEQAVQIDNMLLNWRTSAPGNERVALPTLTGFLYVPVRDIIRCESDNTYTTVFTVDGRKQVISRTLKDCEHQLDGFNFFRVHNSHLVNLKHVVEYLKGEGGLVRMSDGSAVDVSRRRKEEFLRHFNML